MGFVFTIIYVVLTFISPSQFGPEFASYHPMVYLAALTGLASLPEIFRSLSARPAVQTQLAVLFVIAVVVSQLHNGLLAARDSFTTVLPAAVVFFFVVVNVNTFRRLKIMAGIVIATCLGITIEALCGYYGSFGNGLFVLLQFGEIRRMRAAGFLNDPNDLAQFILVALSLMFFAWNRGRIFLNSVLLAAAGFLLWATYLTHSRGALIALGILLIAAFHKKIGTVPSAVVAGLFVVAMLALDFTGGRGISAAAGSDRLELWSEGLQMFKRAPLFGIGFGEFSDSDFAGLTAHNSFVLCLAELGIVGSTIFVGLLVTTIMGVNKLIGSPEPVLIDAAEREGFEPHEPSMIADSYEADGEAFVATQVAVDLQTAVVEPDAGSQIEIDEGEAGLRPFAVAMRLAFFSFITTSWFLSRSYTATMFLVLGLATATISLQEDASEFGELSRQTLATLAVEFAAVLFVYVVVRFRI